ncbi:MAG: hypothetical protein RJA07_1401 [Bacteroidota bacterium]|jgi:hypothetical protein
MIKKISILFLYLGVGFQISYAQVLFKNPSFEGLTAVSQPPQFWNICSGTPDTQPVSWWINQYPISGKSCVGIAYTMNGVEQESIYQKLNCTLYKGKKYTFSVFLNSYVDTVNDGIYKGKIETWIGENSCSKQQRIFISPLLNNRWEKYTINFSPNLDVSYILFNVRNDSNTLHAAYVSIDSLSTIKLIGEKYLEINASYFIDSIRLICNGLIEPLENYIWYDFNNNIVINGNPIYVSPTINTTYIVTATTPCGSIVSDTIFIKGHNNSIKPTTLLSTQSAFRIQQDNHLNQSSLSIYNTLGQLIYQSINYQNDYRFSSSGMYYYQINNNERGKVLVVE